MTESQQLIPNIYTERHSSAGLLVLFTCYISLPAKGPHFAEWGPFLNFMLVILFSVASFIILFDGLDWKTTMFSLQRILSLRTRDVPITETKREQL